MCPICNQFEQQYGEAMQKAAADGKITLEYHPIEILDFRSQGSAYSSRAAGAMFCVAEEAPEKAIDFMNAMFQNQPDEGTAGLTDDQISEIAKGAGAEAAASCIEDGTYKKWGTAQAQQHEIKGTPTVEINGKRLDMSNNADFQKFTDLIG